MDRITLFATVFRHRSSIPMLLAAPIVVAAARGGGVAPPAAALGALLLATGVGLRLLAIRRIGRGARVHRAHASAGLVTQGPYRWSRNPLYLAAALILSGLGFLAGAQWTAALLLVATPLAYTPVVLAEERALEGLLGEHFRPYAAAVPRWFGRPRERSSSQRDVVVPWREVFARERWLVPGCLAAGALASGAGSGLIPLGSALDPLARVAGCSVAALVVAGFGLALAANVTAVELHQRRRRAHRAPVR